jgi:hypothetical protein
LLRLSLCLIFKGNIVPIDLNVDCITNTEGKSTDVYVNNKFLTLITGKYQNTNTEVKSTDDYFNHEVLIIDQLLIQEYKH